MNMHLYIYIYIYTHVYVYVCAHRYTHSVWVLGWYLLRLEHLGAARPICNRDYTNGWAQYGGPNNYQNHFEVFLGVDMI